MKYITLMFLVLISIGAATTTISSLPYTISTPDTYILSSSFSGNYSTAITIASDNVTLDCQGNSITGNYTANTYGIYYTVQNNVTIQNCNVTRFFSELYIRGGNQSTIINNSFTYSNRTDVILGDLSMMNGTYFANNTVQYGDENGVECYNQNNSIFENNTMGFHLFGHGTDRDFQFVQNIYNTIFRYNFLQNSTNSIRLDNNNYTNVLIDSNTMINHQVQGILNQVQVGTFTNVTISNNNVTSIPYPANPTASLDWATAGRLTPLNQCQEWHVFNNTGSTGRPIVYLNQYNSSQSYSNLEVSQLSLCGVQNASFSNITMISVMNNYLEIIDTINVTFDIIHQYNVSSGFFIGGSANNTIITNSDAHNIKLIAINSADPANANIYAENLTFENLVQYGIRPSGTNNTFRNITLKNQFSTIASTGTFGVTTTGTTPTNLILDNIRVYNQTYGMDIFAGTNTTITNSYIENSSTYDFLFNSTASGSKTYSASNLTIGNMGGTKTATFGVVDTVAASEQYGIKLATSFSSPPAGEYAFTGAVLNITAIAGTMNFTSFNMSWSQNDVQLYNESAIILDQYNNVNWITLNNTPDTTNKIIAYNSPALSAGTSNLYGLLSTISNCPIINISGSYLQPINYLDAPNPSTPFLTSDCVDIRVPNVVWDCQNFNISNNVSPPQTIGILADGNNITVKNCNVHNYSYNIYTTGNNLNILNNTLTGENADVGFSSFASQNSNVSGNTFKNLSYGIIMFFGSNYAIISQNNFNNINIRELDGGATTGTVIDSNNFTNGNIGIGFLNANGNNITNNFFNNSGFIGVQQVGGQSNLISNNQFYNSYESIDISGATLNTISNNLFSGASKVEINDGSGNTLNTITNNTFLESAEAIDIGNAVLETISSNLFTNTTSTNRRIFNNNGNTIIIFNNTFNSIPVSINVAQPALATNITGNYFTQVNNTAIYSLGVSDWIFNNTVSGGIGQGFQFAGTNQTVSSNYLENLNQTAITLSSGAVNALSTSNYVFNSSSVGYYLQSSKSINDTAFGGITGFGLSGSDVQLINCTVSNTSPTMGLSTGISANGNNATISGCISHDNVLVGFADLGSNTAFRNNILYNNNPTNIDVGTPFIVGGIVSFAADSSNYSNNTIYSNPTGIGVFTSINTHSDHNEIFSNTLGMFSGGNYTSSFDHLYNNSADFQANGAGSNSSLVTNFMIFDNPAGNYQNYSNISISDIVRDNEIYSVSYAVNVDPTSTGNISVNNATIQISNLGNMSINLITWNYRNGAYNSSNEPSIRVWQFTIPPPTWAALSSILNIPSKTVQLANVGTTGRYTLLYDPDFIGSIINSIIINYYRSQPYSTYTHTSTTITTADTGFFLVNYVTNGVAPDILAPLLTISSFIPIIAIGLLSLIALKAILDAYKQN